MVSQAPGGCGSAIERVVAWHRQLAAEGVQPEAIVKVIQQAIRAKKPKTRYVVPKHPNQAFIAIGKLFPSRMADGLVRRVMKL